MCALGSPSALSGPRLMACWRSPDSWRGCAGTDAGTARARTRTGPDPAACFVLPRLEMLTLLLTKGRGREWREWVGVAFLFYFLVCVCWVDLNEKSEEWWSEGELSVL